MALFVATKARILVTLATAGAMVGGVAGLQAEAQQAAVAPDTSGAQTVNQTTTVATPTPTATAKKKKKHKKKVAAVVVQAPVVKKATKTSHGKSSGSK